MKNFFNEYKIVIGTVLAICMFVVMLTGIARFMVDVNIEQIHREVMMENVNRGLISHERPDRTVEIYVDEKMYRVCVDYYYTPLYGKQPSLPNKLHNSIVYTEEIKTFEVWAKKKYDVYYAVRGYLESLVEDPTNMSVWFYKPFSGYEYGTREDRMRFGVIITGEELGVPELLSHVSITLHDPAKYKELPSRNYTDWFTVYIERFNGPFNSH